MPSPSGNFDAESQDVQPYRILLIEDDEIDQMAFRRFVKNMAMPYDFVIAGSIRAAQQALADGQFDAVIADFNLGDGTTLEIMDEMLYYPTIITTATGDEEVAVKAIKAGAYDYLLKDPERQYLKVLPVTVENAIRKRRAEALNRILTAAVRYTNDCVFITDLSDTISFVNEAFCQTYGYTEKEALGQPASIIATPEDGQSNAIAVGSSGETLHVRRDGQVLPVSISRSEIVDDHGIPFRIVNVAHDITELKNVQMELSNATLAAEAANNAKSEFLANMSHEIRTPMNAIIGMTELLLDTSLSSEQQEFASVVKASADSLLTVINDILDLSKIEAGKLELTPTVFNLEELLSTAVDMFANQAQKKELEILFDIPTDLPRELRGDDVRLRQILINFIGNAVKFTHHGSIRLRVRRVEGTPDRYLFEVRDTGIGLTDASMQRLFQPFTQAEQSTSRQYGGTGLGLAICRRLVALMGGEIGVHSKMDEGSTFWFEVPLPADSPNEAMRFKGRVLVADSIPESAKLTARYLHAFGTEAVTAGGCEEGLELLTAAAKNGVPFTHVLFDWRLCSRHPAALEKMHQSLKVEDRPILIGMTRFGIGAAREANDVPGAKSVIAKPVKPSRLLEVLVRSMELGSEDAISIREGVKHTREVIVGSNLQVMIVEDNLFNQQVVRHQFRSLQMSPVICSDAREALSRLAEDPYDVIFMDCQLPGMDGYEATREIRRLEEAGEMPGDHRLYIIAMTAHALTNEQVKCRNAGMDDFVSKPAQLHDIRAALERSQAALSGVLADVPVEVVGETNEEVAIFDMSTVNSLRSMSSPGGPDVFMELLDIFEKDSLQRMQALETAMAAQDMKAVHRLAHSLNGMAANLGALSFRSAAVALEHATQAGGCADLEPLLAELRSAYAAVCRYVEQQRQPKS